MNRHLQQIAGLLALLPLCLGAASVELMPVEGSIISYVGGPGMSRMHESFSTPTSWGELPAGWVDRSQLGSAPVPQPFYASGQDFPAGEGNGALGGCLKITAPAGDHHRPKVMSRDAAFSAGEYRWQVYVPLPGDERAGLGWEADANVALGCWLYSPLSTDGNDRELDFEIGWGKHVRGDLPDNMLICYMTAQADASTGTEHQGGWVPIEGGHWYELSMRLATSQEGNYEVEWFIRRLEDTRAMRRARYAELTEPRFRASLNYGPEGEHATPFYVCLSVENFPPHPANGATWLGDQSPPSADHHGWFSEVSYRAER